MMNYFLKQGSIDFAAYEEGGVLYPVFAEKYGNDPIRNRSDFLPLTDTEEIEALEKYMHPYEEGKPKVYMAGPLFNEGDRYVNACNSDALRAAGYTTFLPQEIVITDRSSPLVKAACFYMDLRAIRACDVLLANCNGIEIDSGTAAEIGLAYGLGKRSVFYKSDVRNYFSDVHRLNNFVAALTDYPLCRTTDEVLAVLKSLR